MTLFNYLALYIHLNLHVLGCLCIARFLHFSLPAMILILLGSIFFHILHWHFPYLSRIYVCTNWRLVLLRLLQPHLLLFLHEIRRICLFMGVDWLLAPYPLSFVLVIYLVIRSCVVFVTIECACKLPKRH